jgi:hypothetical protein
LLATVASRKLVLVSDPLDAGRVSHRVSVWFLVASWSDRSSGIGSGELQITSHVSWLSGQ